jgi:hypothetical protein
MPNELAICVGCGKKPEEIPEYVDAAQEANVHNDEPACNYCLAIIGQPHLSTCTLYVSPERYVWQEEGTLNMQNGHFLCTNCYIDAGMPSSPTGWTAP